MKMHYGFNKKNSPKIVWNKYELPNVPLLTTKLPKEVVDRLWDYIEKSKTDIKKNNKKRSLAGNISSSLTLHDEDDYLLKNIFSEVVNLYLDPKKIGVKWFRAITSHWHPEFSLSSLWVNFQKQTEFNPMHDHSGILSFVIWLKIPTDYREQHKIPFVGESNSPAASDFQLIYTDILGNVVGQNIVMDKNMENCMIVFPSQLKHQVYPFYNCDDERISISGNISLNSKNSVNWM